jgi:hypothetical protein
VESSHHPSVLPSPNWEGLRTAYGDAGEIPALLERVRNFPVSSSYQDEPWGSLWSALCHQGDVYTASFAAVPYIVEALSTDPVRADFNYFLLPTCIELARIEDGMQIPAELEFTYLRALRELPVLAAKAAKAGWGDEKSASALAAIAVSTGKYELAKLLVEVEPSTYKSILERIFEE